MDAEQFSKADQKLRALGRGAAPTRAPRPGQDVADDFSTGVRPDVFAGKELPYRCHRCQEAFVMATHLSDHLKRRHDIVKHPSLITPTAGAKTGVAGGDM